MEVSTLKELKIENIQQSTASVSTKVVQCRSKRATEDGGYGTGRRKNAVARVWVKAGKGVITINKKDISEYFPRDSYKKLITQPFVDTKTTGLYDVVCTTKGGGTTGQAGAILHGIARALDCISEDFHTILRKNGFLTRDSRVVERKKYGKRKARKSTQFSKR